MNANPSTSAAVGRRPAHIPTAALLILCAVTAGVGLWQVRQVAALATSRAQDILLMQTAAIAQSVIPEQAQALTFTERDLASPIYQRLRREFDAVSG
ncbi:MAG: hypothetical protein GX590_00380, partial [Lentisphaerae bacterium]|nr:hypothetical protein [Lentisphaerota bacterium]